MSSESGRVQTILKALPLIVIDLLATVVAYLSALWATFQIQAFYEFGNIPKLLLVMLVVNIVVFTVGKLYSTRWEYASVDEAIRIVAITLLSTFVGGIITTFALGFYTPWRILILGWFILTIIVGASRFAIRMYSGRRSWTLLGIHESTGAPRSIIVGAGETGSLTVQRMHAGNPSIPGCPICLVDDNPKKVGSYVHGIKVMGTVDELPQICKRLSSIEQIVVAVPRANKKQREHIFQKCLETGIRTLTLPAIYEMPQNMGDSLAVREVEIADLLERDEIDLDLEQLAYVTDKVILVTGAGGSIGSELVRQLIPAKPKKIVLFDIYENTTYELYHEILRQALSEGVLLCTEIGTITNQQSLHNVFKDHVPQVVFHAAAHKHVPLMEQNPNEAIENNVFGTINLLQMIEKFNCSHFVMISTDKAVNPTNVMGATKRMDEMIMQCYAARAKKAGIDSIFTAVRFGNVLGSHGSVIPLFKRQLKQGGPITLTSKEMTRFFMTIPEASKLVITAGALAHGGEIFVLNMGDPVKIYNLAVNLVRLSGLRLGEDIEIEEVGLRPGEKMYEELLMKDETTIPTTNSDITICIGTDIDEKVVESSIQKLRDVIARNAESAETKRVLAEAVPTYTPQF